MTRTVSIPNQAHAGSSRTYPVDWIASGDARPGKSRISSGALRSMVPANMALLDGLTELGQAVRASSEAPAKVVDNEALDAGGLGCINHGSLMGDCSRRDGAYDGVLARHGLCQALYRVGSPDNGNAWRKDGYGLGASDDGYFKAGIAS